MRISCNPMPQSASNELPDRGRFHDCGRFHFPIFPAFGRLGPARSIRLTFSPLWQRFFPRYSMASGEEHWRQGRIAQNVVEPVTHGLNVATTLSARELQRVTGMQDEGVRVDEVPARFFRGSDADERGRRSRGKGAHDLKYRSSEGDSRRAKGRRLKRGAACRIEARSKALLGSISQITASACGLQPEGALRLRKKQPEVGWMFLIAPVAFKSPAKKKALRTLRTEALRQGRRIQPKRKEDHDELQ